MVVAALQMYIMVVQKMSGKPLMLDIGVHLLQGQQYIIVFSEIVVIILNGFMMKLHIH